MLSHAEGPFTSTAPPGGTISYDRTWQKRGHGSHVVVEVALFYVSTSSLTTVMPVIEGLNRLLTTTQNGIKTCQKNVEGSVNAMGTEAAKYIFKFKHSEINIAKT